MRNKKDELLDEACVALNRSTALLMEFSNFMLKTGFENHGMTDLITNNLSLLERINKEQ